MNNWNLLSVEDKQDLLLEEGFFVEEAVYFAQEDWYCIPAMIRRLILNHF